MVIESHSGINVLRDDLLPGGTKSVILPHILEKERWCYVYASPVYGGMQIALASYCKSIGKQAVIFCAKRKVPHGNSLRAKDAGALVYQVPYGYLSHTQKKAREYAQQHNAQLVEFGGNYPIAIKAISERMRQVSARLGREPDVVYCASGSGTLLRGIISGTETARIVSIQVGAEVGNPLPERVTIKKYHKPFEKESTIKAPFPSCANYDLKGWEYCIRDKPGGMVLFWNVL
jgi:threonine dehydratase